MQLFKRSLSAILCGVLLASVCACGGTPATSGDTENAVSDDTTVVEEKKYPYYDGNDFGGKTFHIYNVKKALWNMICVIQPDEVNGETVNDAIYNRNEFVKQKLNCEIEETNADDYSKMATELQTLVLAGDAVYDAAYMPMYLLIGGLTEGYYQRLDTVDSIHLNEDWWDQVMVQSTSIDRQNYCAASSAHLMGWDGLWCLFFNEDMMDDLGQEYPYQLVRDGKWTIDALAKYCKAAANLNGDDSFAINADGKSVYGCLSFYNVVTKFLFGFNVNFVTKNKDDMPELSCENEKFISACQKLSNLCVGGGEFRLNASSDSTLPEYYQNFYEKGRCLFLGAELKTSQLLRNMTQSFGILPYPKLDENQENYRSTTVHQVAAFTIPITNDKPNEVGLLFDALSYESQKMVLEPYFNVMVEQKGLRNEESVEMLNIIKSTRSFDLGISYQWCAKMEEKIKSGIAAANIDIASAIAETKSAAVESMNKMLDKLAEK